MPRIPCRKFTLADIMILVAASAAGLALARTVLKTQNSPWYFAYPMGAGSPIVLGLTVGLLVIRLRKPRPAARRLFRQPGAAASLVALASVAVWSVFLGIAAGSGNPDRGLDGFSYVGFSAGPAVLGAWILLGITQTGRREPGWIDRLGLALGCAWIALMLLVLFETFVK